MKSIYQLLPDVRKFISSREDLSVPLTITFGERKDPPTLRLSKMAPMCPKHLWHSIHTPELAEALPPEAIFKFTYGHTIEAMAIALAKAAGHDVRGEQDELVVDGIKGHIDCILDGCIVDVKSCSKRMFEKFQTKSIAYDDSFGYLAQLDGYLVGSAEDDRVTVKDFGYIWAIDKTLGKMVLYEHRIRKADILHRIADHKRIVSASQPPHCECGVLPDGESGNIILGVKASYSPFKHVCFPGLRTILYSGGPRYFTKVAKWPKHKGVNLPELDIQQGLIYNV